MHTEKCDSTNQEQGSGDVANNSRNEFFKDLRFSFEGPTYQVLLDEMWKEYVSSDAFCEQDQDNRINYVYHFHKVKEILSKLEKEVSYA